MVIELRSLIIFNQYLYSNAYWKKYYFNPYCLNLTNLHNIGGVNEHQGFEPHKFIFGRWAKTHLNLNLKYSKIINKLIK